MTPGEVLRGAGASEASPVAFLFPGGGAQYAGMARDLYAKRPEFRDALDACSRIYEDRAGRSLTTCIFEGEGALDQPTVALRRCSPSNTPWPRPGSPGASSPGR